MSEQSKEFTGGMPAGSKQAETAITSKKNGSVGKTTWQNQESGGGETGRRKGVGAFEMGSENLLGNGANLDEDDRNLKQHPPLAPKPTNWSSFAENTSPKEFTTQNQKSQDGGFWEGEVVKELCVEKQRSQYYDEDEDEE